MKTRTLIGLCFLSIITFQPYHLLAQGTAFTYQGRLTDGAGPASGKYDFRFKLYADPSSTTQIGSSYLTNAVPVTNALFTTTIDFGSGIFNGSNYWLQIEVKTNNAGSYTTLNPLQAFASTPYAVFASTASNLTGTLPTSKLSGTVANGQLANGSVTVTAGTGLGGGGTVALGGTTTLNNTGIISVASGSTDLNVLTTSGTATLTDTATNVNTASRIVKRDANGNFSASSVTVSNLNLPVTSATTGIINYDGFSLIHLFGTGNFFAGQSAGNFTQTGPDNTGIGDYVLVNVTSGYGNTGLGTDALNRNTSGYHNTACGEDALFSNLSGFVNTALGQSALSFNTNGIGNTAVGASALASSASGNGNTAVGESALVFNITGGQNTAVGQLALQNNVAGLGNTAIGQNTMAANTNGTANTSLGGLSLNSETAGDGDVAIGYQSLNKTTNSFNTACGFQALFNSTTGAYNIGLGAGAGQSITLGGSNICIGNFGSASDTNVIRIGDKQTKAFMAGISGVTSSGGAAVFVNAAGQLGTVTSSARFKENIHNMNGASDVLLTLRPVTFNYKPDLDPQGIPQFGLVAEEVAKADPDLVVRDEKNQPYTVRYEAVNAMLLNEFLKQHKTVEDQASRIESLQQSVSQLKELVNKLVLSKAKGAQ